MPAAIDQAWEYWVPDPEVAEALDEAARIDPAERLFDGRHRGSTSLKGRNEGLRWGKGDPDRWVPQREARADALCGCGAWFVRRRFAQAHCSLACAARSSNRGPDKATLGRLAVMYAGGTSRAEIAAALGVTERTVKRWRALAGIEVRGPGGRR